MNQAEIKELYLEFREDVCLARFETIVVRTIQEKTIRDERTKLFPMQSSSGFAPKIPWWLAEKIYKVYSALYGTDQSLKRMSERGGFGWSEVEWLCKEYFKKFGKHPDI